MATEIFVPVLGESITEAILAAWLKQPGDAVRRGDELAEIETAKATMPLECPLNGILLKIVVEAGSVVVPGQLLALVGKADECVEEIASAAPQPETREEGALPDYASFAARTAAGSVSRPAEGQAARQRVSPAARRLARQLGIDISQVQPALPGRRVTTIQVQAASKTDQPSQALPFERRPLNSIRRALAAQMSESARTIPQFSVSCEANAQRLLAERDRFAVVGQRYSLTVLLCQLTARSLLEHPLLNARFDGESIILYKTVNLGVAVAGEHGLTAPVIQHAEQLGLAALQSALAELAAAARSGRLTLPQVSGATFTLSNLGMLGVSQFTPLVNPPQSAILGIGALRPAFQPTPAGGFEPVQWMTLSLSADHRVLDGAEAAAFLNTLKSAIENPMFDPL